LDYPGCHEKEAVREKKQKKREGKETENV